MKKLLGIAVIFLSLPVNAFATDIAFTSSGSIVTGDTYGLVSMRNDGTVVNMTGGQVSQLSTSYNHNCIFNMSGGKITDFILMRRLNTFNFSGGSITAAFELGGTVNLSGGSIDSWGKITGSTSITGGSLNFSKLMIYGQLDVYGGLLNISDFEHSGGITNIYGSDFSYNSASGILTGYLLDGNQFAFAGVTDYDYQHINLIPEPMSVVFVGIGLLTLRKRK